MLLDGHVIVKDQPRKAWLCLAVDHQTSFSGYLGLLCQQTFDIGNILGLHITVKFRAAR
jgi:hypothetical protein